MMNPFPIQFLALFAYFIVRICIAGILIHLGVLHLKKRDELKNILKFSWFPFGLFSTVVFGLSEIILGVFLLIGAHTQIAALIVALMSLKMLVLRSYFKHPTIPPKIFYVLLLATSLSLVITGAGVFAFDLPL